jgi:hypothetical protein
MGRGMQKGSKMDVNKVIEFADSLCEDARGDLTKMNRIGVNKALKFYMDNVIMLATVSRETFATCYPQFMEEIDGIRVKAEKVQEAETEHVNQGDRIATLETKLDKLTAALTRYMEDTTEDTEEEEEDEPEAPKKRRTRKKKSTSEESEGQEEAPAETNAEADAETSDESDD